LSELSRHVSLREVFSTAVALNSVGASGGVVISFVVPVAVAGADVPASFCALTSKL